QVVDVVPEVQSVSILASAGEDFFLSFLEQNITVAVGSDTTASIQTSLEALLTIEAGNVEVASTVGSSTVLTIGDSFTVEFTGVYGDVPLLTPRPASRATVTTITQGDAPFRKETQAFSCSADSVGDLLVTWR
ncbi:unnamed protein product, partial [Laminaria digitata]